DGATLIYTTDDNILDLRIEGEVARWLSPAQQGVVRCVVAEADGVSGSTPPLARQMEAFNRVVLEVPNAVDERLFRRPIEDEPRAANNRPLVIGYMGTATHDDDLLAIAPALRQVLAGGGGGVEFELVGGVARPDTLKEFAGLPVRVRQAGHE